ncbi:MAG: hypothetical protein C4567_17475 [Deltaproteobacteria bacterium]|nr:MAG: hypothetical protein C4567_17475 [Deltaproteobacteria bacterium]
MKKIMGLVAMLLAGSLATPGNLRFASQVLAQSQAPPMTDKQYQELQQKRQEEWEYLDQKEKKQYPGVRRPAADKRQEDAIKRQKDAERRLRELEEEEQ